MATRSATNPGYGAACACPAARTDDAPATRPDCTLTCPACHAATRVQMPTDTCQFFWDCPACGTTLRPKPGDCCVFCSYGDSACPSIQARRALNSPTAPH